MNQENEGRAPADTGNAAEKMHCGCGHDDITSLAVRQAREFLHDRQLDLFSGSGGSWDDDDRADIAAAIVTVAAYGDSR